MGRSSGWDLPKVSANEIYLKSGKEGREGGQEGVKNLIAMNWDIQLMERLNWGRGHKKRWGSQFLWPE